MLTYTRISVGVLAILLLWFGLTLAFVKPPIREVLSRRHSNLPFSSSSSTAVVDSLLKDIPHDASTLFGPEFNKEPRSQLTLEEKSPSIPVTTNKPKDFIIIRNPFSDVAASVKVSTSPSLALYPFVRRMSMPRHRPSFCIPPSHSNTVATLPQRATVFRHGSLAEDNDSYLPSPHVPSGKVRLIPDDDEKEQNTNYVLPVSETQTTKLKSLPPDQPKKSTKFKRVRKRVRELFHQTLKP
ncbi:hypothetical protein C0992_000406 [Termitomyces sp. T32_za158]|nr:hypothetical protein C0992_000406 [Termitomyces sp. T32_za158]